MKLLIQKPSDNASTLFRRAGYIFQRQEGNEMSFIRPLARAGYPRFHCYTKTVGIDIECSFHLDQKKETYGRETRHHGEYTDEGALREERERIESIFGNVSLVA